MKKFNFRLFSLLKYRKETEHLKRKELFLASTHLFFLQNQIKELEKEYSQIVENIRQKKTLFLKANEISSAFAYLNHLSSKIKLHHYDLLRAQQKVEKHRQSVIMAMQKRKIVENLQEKQYAEWEYVYEETEKAFFDELATIRYMRDKEKR